MSQVPQTRQKRSRSPGAESQDGNEPVVAVPAASPLRTAASLHSDALKKEKSINLKESLVQLVNQADGEPEPYPSPAPLIGEIKWLITDFTVRELDAEATDARPLYLTELTVPDNCKPVQASTEGVGALTDVTLEKLVDAFTNLLSTVAPTGGDTVTAEDDVEKLYNLTQNLTKGASHTFSRSFETKEQRTAIHKQVRAVLGLQFESVTVDIPTATDPTKKNNGIKIIFVGAKGEKAFAQRNKKNSWPEGRGEFLHFTAYKENIDSSSMLRTLAAKLSMAQKGVQFSGTKDKRGVTLQRLCIHKGEASRVAGLNNVGFGRNAVVKLGNFEYKNHGLMMGKLKGNYFSIIVRKLERVTTDGGIMTAAEVAAHGQKVADTISKHGFINYFGPQRFGTTSIATSTVGCALLAKRYRDVVLMCLRSKTEFVPDVQVALELGERGEWLKALETLPHYCYQERDMLGVLAKNPNDYAGAISAIPRPTAMLFAHSVQSLVWNEMASRRIRRDSLRVVAGDLVLAGVDDAKMQDEGEVEEDAAGGGEDADAVVEFAEGGGSDPSALPQVHVVTADEAEEGKKFTLRDVVLPVPGPDSQLQFPAGPAQSSVGVDKDGYVRYLDEIGASVLLDPSGKMESDALTKKFHFHGTYRKLIAVPLNNGEVKIDAKMVANIQTPCVDTDLMKLNRIHPPSGGNKRERKKERKINEAAERERAAAGSEKEAVPAKDATEDAVPPPAPTGPPSFAPAEGDEGIPVLEISFALGAGCYATSLLREIATLVRSS